MVAHVYCHIKTKPTVKIPPYGKSNGLSHFTPTLTFSLFSPLHYVPFWSGPPFIYGKDSSFYFSFSFFTVHFKPKNPSLVSQSESDWPQKKDFTSLHSLCIFLLASFNFLFFFFIFNGDLEQRVTFVVVFTWFQLVSSFGS
jgi:hypothetical protein